MGRACDAGARAAPFVPADRVRRRVRTGVAGRAEDGFATPASGEARMNAMRRLIVSVLMDLCAAVLPAGKSEWLQAMQVEAAHIEARDVMGFAAGCLLACCKERVTFMSNIPAAARYGIIAAMLVYAVFALRSAMHSTGGQGLTASIFG